MRHTGILLLAGSVALTGCGSTMPLVFLDKSSAGIAVSTDNGLDVSVGFNTISISLVPVAVRQKDKEGGVTAIESLQAEDGPKKDAYSTFGNFTTDTNADAKTASTSIGLGRFFATGMAAQNISTKVGEALVEKAKK